MDTNSDERTWIEKAKNGDQRAYRKLYDTHVTQLFRFLRQYSQDVVEVEEWVQRAFIKAYHNLPSFRGNSRFSTWLFTIALNEMKSDFRHKKILTLPEQDVPEQSSKSEEEQFAWNDSMRILLSGLEDRKRTVFMLFEVEGFSHSEIASMLKIEENASRTLLCRAKQWLRTQWEQMEKAV